MPYQSEILHTRSEQDEEAGFVKAGDRELVDLTLAGDESAFERLFQRHKRHVAMVAGRFFPHSQDIEEVIQATFIKAYLELKNFRGEHEFSMVSWLGRIAATTCLNTLRRRARKIETQFVEISKPAAEALADDLLEKSAEELILQRDLLEKLLDSLEVEDRMLLKMLYAEEMTVAEVASVFGWSRAKVKIRAFRSRRALRKTLRKFL
jgi:RNA polymerase sigma-70 factor (ECF subfamily)